jgi:hypothetical protein
VKFAAKLRLALDCKILIGSQLRFQGGSHHQPPADIVPRRKLRRQFGSLCRVDPRPTIPAQPCSSPLSMGLAMFIR